MTSRVFLCLIAALALPAGGEEPFKPGHSMQGEAFDEGPRQFAHLLPGCTSVHFAVTTDRPEAQQFFDQGLTQLHGFWYFEAERSFRQAAYLDPDCAMAYCGMALANLNNDKRANGFIAQAVKRREQAGPREQRWISMWSAWFTADKGKDRQRRDALVHALEEEVYDFPDDLEARAFLLLQLWEDESEHIPLVSRLAVSELALPVLAANPTHPGVHHYLIHLWNQGKTDRLALPDAALCGPSAPGIAHLWHMSGHTYTGLKRYADAAWQQEASARVDHAYMREARIMPEQIHNYAHNNEWLVRDLALTGRVHEAVSLAKNLVELPRLDEGHEAAWRMGRDRLLDLGANFELWDELTALEDTPYLSPGAKGGNREIERLRTLGVAWYAQGNAERGATELAALEARLKELRAARAAGPEKEEPARPDKETGRAGKGSGSSRLNDLENAIAEVRVARALAASDPATAGTELPLVHDLSPARTARYHLALGDFDAAEKALRDAIAHDPADVLPYALLAEVQEKAGQPGEAEKTLQTLRPRASQLDLASPVFARLAPIAARLNLPADWRPPFEPAADVGQRPPLDSLGPFRWQPYLAPAFALPDQNGQTVSLTPGDGAPALVVFYLGAGCSKCIEQLHTLSPVAPEFTAAGIRIIAVSTETPEDLAKTFEQAKDGVSYPFPIVSDHGLESFKAYRAYDDFEGQPIHGAFLVDGKGRVRWQNISFQPFDQATWLLGESKRLLALPE